MLELQYTDDQHLWSKNASPPLSTPKKSTSYNGIIPDWVTRAFSGIPDVFCISNTTKVHNIANKKNKY